MELPDKYNELLRVTIYLSRYEKTMAEIEAARLSTSLANLGRVAVNAFVLESQRKATPLEEAVNK